MRILKTLLTALLTSLTSLIILADPHPNGLMTANAGTRFELSATGDPTVLAHTANGIAQVSLIGNCRVHFDVRAHVAPPGEPWQLEGAMSIVTADGQSVLHMNVVGWFLPDSEDPFGDFHYDAVVTSGEGQFAGARGKAQIDGAGMFTAPLEGTATWLLKGNIATRPAD